MSATTVIREDLLLLHLLRLPSFPMCVQGVDGIFLASDFIRILWYILTVCMQDLPSPENKPHNIKNAVKLQRNADSLKNENKV